MATYREAVLHARRGGTIRRLDKVVRFLAQEEANAYHLEHNPSRRIVRDKKGKPVEKDGKLVIETYGETSRPRALGLFDVSQDPPVLFQPTDDDIYAIEVDEAGEEQKALRSDWHLEGIDQEPGPVIDDAPVDDAPILVERHDEHEDIQDEPNDTTVDE